MVRKLILICALASFCPLAAHAATAVIGGAGPRVGFSTSPDQIVFGGQLIIGELAPDLTFDPSLDLGFGDNVTVINPNLDLHYHFSIRDTEWRPYVGAGVAINFVQFDAPPGIRDDSETDVGGSLIFGAGVPTSSGNRFFAELKFGLGDTADFKAI